MKNPIKSFIKKKGMTESGLARAVGMSQATVNRHCNSKTAIGANAIAAYSKIGIPTTDLLSWNTQLKKKSK